jgi:hypothetical protein
MDHSNFGERTSFARTMLQDGKTTKEVRAAIRQRFSAGIGQGLLTALRKEVGLRPGPTAGVPRNKRRNGSRAPAAIAAREAFYIEKLKQGRSASQAARAVKRKFGVGLGSTRIWAIRNRVRAELRAPVVEQMRARMVAPRTDPKPANPIEPRSDVLDAFVTARLPFRFDGAYVFLLER